MILECLHPDDVAFLSAISSFPFEDFSASNDHELQVLLSVIPPPSASPVANDEPLAKRLRREDSTTDTFLVSKRSLLTMPSLKENPENSIHTIEPKSMVRPSPKARDVPMETLSSPARKRTSSSESCSSSSGEPTSFCGLAAGTNGEHRIRIKFDSFGRLPENEQHYGKNGCVIPDGLNGTHDMYEQQWRFEVVHNAPQTAPNNKEGIKTVVPITWRIFSLATGLKAELTETPQQAFVRETSGRTVCNKVVKMALEARAKELEDRFEAHASELDLIKRNNTMNCIRILRPRLCTVGLLFFGLLHDTVQIECAAMKKRGCAL